MIFPSFHRLYYNDYFLKFIPEGAVATSAKLAVEALQKR